MNSRIHLAILFFELICQLTFADAQFRIKNGANTEIEESAHSVAIYVCCKYTCVGSLVSPQFVITAAHCVVQQENELGNIKLRAGVADINKSAGQRRNVAYIHYDGGYDKQTEFMDIAVVKAAKKFDLSVRIEPIGFCDADLKSGTTLRLSGWGAETGFNNVLQTAEMPIVEIEDCKGIYKNKLDPIIVPETVICAGLGVSDVCPGDSGAGALVNGRLCAVVLSRCLDPSIPSLFLDITNKKVKDFLKIELRGLVLN